MGRWGTLSFTDSKSGHSMYPCNILCKRMEFAKELASFIEKVDSTVVTNQLYKPILHRL